MAVVRNKLKKYLNRGDVFEHSSWGRWGANNAFHVAEKERGEFIALIKDYRAAFCAGECGVRAQKITRDGSTKITS